MCSGFGRLAGRLAYRAVYYVPNNGCCCCWLLLAAPGGPACYWTDSLHRSAVNAAPKE